MSLENFRDLENRTLEFAKSIVRACKLLPYNVVSIELIKQCVRSGCSIGANYREANEALGKKDFVLRLRIARKEAKETSYWLELLKDIYPDNKGLLTLLSETQELRNILSAILEKAKL